MAEDMAAGILRAPAEEIGKGIVVIVKRLFNYLCCFSKNVEMMRKEAQDLKDKRDELQGRVDAASRNAETIVPRVTTWLTNTSQKLRRKDEIETQIPNAQSRCLNFASRFSLSKQAIEATEAMKELLNTVCKSDESISQPAPPVSTVPIALGKTIEFQSRKKLEDDIMNALSRAEFSIVGIGGMGGVGKTTMAKRIVNWMRTQKLVDEAVIVVVSQPVDMLKIQREIAESLGLNLKEVESLQARADKLRVRITSTKRMIIVLDDIWGKINLEELGIPGGEDFSGCVTLLTSRDKELLNRMGAHVFAMTNLPQEEAWILFKDKVGSCVDHPDLVSIAEQVVEECRGLPVAIVALGSALKDETNKEIWQDALDQLGNSKQANITDLIKDVYMPLRLSYDRLDSEGAKLLFLLCCLFPEDYSISLEDLALYGMGLNLFEGVQSLVKTRNRVRAEVKKLKSRCLLLEGDDENEVKMHDVIRDVAIFIASKEQRPNDMNLRSDRQFNSKKCKWISLMSRGESSLFDHLMGFNFPELVLLIIHQLSYDDLQSNACTILKEMQGLQVLSFERVSFQSSLQIIGWPNKLVTLKFERCNLRTLSFVGELFNLKVLYCNECYPIEELPVEIGQLKCLELLHLCGCRNLERIGAGIISQLVELEELKIWNSFRRWEGKNASLKELESLRKLTCLEIQIQDSNLAAEAINLSPTLVKFQISIGEVSFPNRSNYERAIFFRGIKNEINYGSWIWKLLATTEELHLDEDGVGNWGHLSQTYNTLKRFEIENCELLKPSSMTTFPKLETLVLRSLPSLKSVWKGSKSIEFPSLKTLYIGGCEELKSLLVPSTETEENFRNDDESAAVLCPQTVTFITLKQLTISKCQNIKAIFSFSTIENWNCLEYLNVYECEKVEEVVLRKEKNGDEEKVSYITFPNLKSLVLRELPFLTSFGKGIESIDFPLLNEFVIMDCPKFKEMVNVSLTDTNEEEMYSWHEKVTFTALEKLRIHGCHNIKAIFTFSTIEKCNRLEYLWVYDCEKVEEVMLKKEKNKDGENMSYITFPKLKSLELTKLPSLTSFGKGIESIDFPLLEDFDIKYCPKFTEMVNVFVTDSNEKEMYSCHKKVKFHRLRWLQIKKCCLMTDTWFHQIHLCSFSTLDRLAISECHKIMSLLSTSIVEKFVNLSNLIIENCNLLEEVIRKEENDSDEGKPCHITFPKLTTLELNGLSSLRSFSKGIESIEFLCLKRLKISSCPKLMRIIVSPMEESNEQREEKGSSLNNGSFSILCNDKVKFRELENLYIEDCRAISSLISSSAAENFRSLKHLIIKKCQHMKTLVMGEKEVHDENSILFPGIEELKIKNLPMLEMLCEWKCTHLEWPLLSDVSIDLCPEMKLLTQGSLSTPKLYKVRIEKEEFEQEEGIGDLNRFLHQHIMATREVWKFPNVSEASQLSTLRLPEAEAEEDPLSTVTVTVTVTPRNVVQLHYGDSGQEILALASNGMYKRWKWDSNHCNPYANSSAASTLPLLIQSTQVPLIMSNDEDDNNPTQDSLACSQHFFSECTSAKFSVFDEETYQVIKTLMSLPPATTFFLVFVDDDDEGGIAIGMEDSTIKIYNGKDEEVKAELMGGHQKQISGLTISPKLKILVSSGADARLCVWRFHGWEMEKSCPIQGPPGHPAPLVGETSVQFHGDQYHLLVVHESQIAIYDPQLDCVRLWYPKDSLSSPISSAIYSCDGRIVFAGFCDGAVGIFDFDSLAIRCRIAPCAYLSSPIPSNDNVFPLVIATHPTYANQFALGMSNGEVYVIEPSNAETHSEGSTSLENKVLPSIPTSIAINNQQPSEN